MKDWKFWAACGVFILALAVAASIIESAAKSAAKALDEAGGVRRIWCGKDGCK
jgi:hypothetical protein